MDAAGGNSIPLGIDQISLQIDQIPFHIDAVPGVDIAREDGVAGNVAVVTFFQNRAMLVCRVHSFFLEPRCYKLTRNKRQSRNESGGGQGADDGRNLHFGG